MILCDIPALGGGKPMRPALWDLFGGFVCYRAELGSGFYVRDLWDGGLVVMGLEDPETPTYIRRAMKEVFPNA